MAKKIVFTDLDGTLLDLETYSFDAALDGVKVLKENKIPIVFCSSKTSVEQEWYRNKLNINGPYIVENGSAVYVPQGYFKRLPADISLVHGYNVITLGVDRPYILSTIDLVRKKLGIEAYGYADLEISEVAEILGMDVEQAFLATRRDYSESLIKGDFESALFTDFKYELSLYGLQCICGGRFWTVSGINSNKGRAIKMLTSLYKDNNGQLLTAGVGDSANDLQLFEAVNIPYIVKRPDNTWLVDQANLNKVNAIGPEGWTLMARDFVQRTM